MHHDLQTCVEDSKTVMRKIVNVRPPTPPPLLAPFLVPLRCLKGVAMLTIYLHFQMSTKHFLVSCDEVFFVSFELFG